MTDSDKTKQQAAEADAVASATNPLVFISHDSRDADLAEAFGKLLKSVSAGMIKSFRSSDKKGPDGIDFGDEWYKRLMSRLQATSDVVCLFTERSLNRPWILFEAGVAKGKLSTPVVGVALGVPLSRVAAGPFYQFQNMDDSEDDLIKLVRQLARRVPNLELDDDVVKSQVAAFKAAEATILKSLSPSAKVADAKSEPEENSLAKLVEEMKSLPTRVAERLSDVGDPGRRRKMRHFHPMMFEEVLRMSGDSSDPLTILMAASLLREDAPWLYELAIEAYRVARSGDLVELEREMERLEKFTDMRFPGPLMEEFGIGGKDLYLVHMEFPRILQHFLRRTFSQRLEEPKLKPGTSSIDEKAIAMRIARRAESNKR